MQTYDVVIIGAGASGLMCGYTAGLMGKSVVILERQKDIARKVLASGGGRCNFTNVNANWQTYISNNPHFVKSALSQYTVQDFIDMVNQEGIEFYEKKKGQLFCKNSSSEIVNMMLKKCKSVNADIKNNCNIEYIKKEDNGSFSIATSTGIFKSKSVVIATGSSAWNSLGSTDFSYDIAKQFGHKIVPVSPALVGLVSSNITIGKTTFPPSDLAGLSLPNIKVSCGKKSFEDDLLFTHKGLSGPAILQISSYWQKADKITIDLLPQTDFFKHLLSLKSSNCKKPLSAILKQMLPSRLAEKISNSFDVPNGIANAKKQDLQAIANNINNLEIFPSKTVGLQQAEICKGGIDTNEISSKTLESKIVSGLFFIGESLDVAGHLGGYNLQWAWSSGYTAGINC